MKNKKLLFDLCDTEKLLIGLTILKNTLKRPLINYSINFCY